MRLLVLVLNLERRPDRREWIEQSVAVPAGDELVVVQAADGRLTCSAQALQHHGFEFSAAPAWALTATVRHMPAAEGGVLCRLFAWGYVRSSQRTHGRSSRTLSCAGRTN
jgi:hypothetical protein